MRIFVIIIILFSLICCKDATDKEKEIKTLSVSKEIEINGTKDTLIYQIGGLALTNDSTFFISDLIDYKIKIFEKNGIFQSKFGKKGNNSVDFKKAPFKLAYDNFSKRLAVYEYSSDLIKYFNQKLKQVGQLKLQAPIIDFQFDNESNLITAYSLTFKKLKYINFWDKKGNNIFSFNPVNLTGSTVMDLFKFSYNKYLNKIIVVYLFRNLIQVYNKNGNIEKEFSLPFLPEQSEINISTVKTSFGTIQRKLPIHPIFHSLTTDNSGKIYLLAGYYSNGGEKKRIYAVNIDGSILNKIELDIKVKDIYADDNNCLFAISENNNTIIKYRINEK